LLHILRYIQQSSVQLTTDERSLGLAVELNVAAAKQAAQQ